MRDLISRLEKAESGSRELDAEMIVALDIRPEWISKIGILWVDTKGQPFPVVRYAFDLKRSPGNPPIGPFPAYTTSLDAIVSLIGEKLPKAGIDMSIREGWGAAEVWTTDDEAVSNAKTAPLALCIALLKALSQGGEHGS